MTALRTEGLGKRYGRTWALGECTLAIPAGHVAALVGPNGAGKTTLLNLAVGLAEPSAGAVTVLGGLPPGLQSYVKFSIGVSTASKAPGAARDLQRFLTSPAVIPVFKAKGLERD